MPTTVLAAPAGRDSAAIESHRAGAETYSGDSELCRKKMVELLEFVHLPPGILPLDDIEEVGCNRDTRFVWLKQKRKKEHTFRKIDRLVSYAPVVTAFVEDRRMKNITGVRSKELLIWATVSDMSIDQDNPTNITFRNPTGLRRTFPVGAFQPEDSKE